MLNIIPTAPEAIIANSLVYIVLDFLCQKKPQTNKKQKTKTSNNKQHYIVLNHNILTTFI